MKFRLLAVFLVPAAMLWPVPSHAQSEKQDAAVSPVVTLGEISEAEKVLLFNGLQSGLSRSYKLISQSKFQRAQEKAFQELDLAQCTEEQCIRKIQEILQVERLFILQAVRLEDLTQLSLTVARLDDRIVRTAACQSCGIVDLVNKVEGLVQAVRLADVGQEQAPAAGRPAMFAQITVTVSVPGAKVEINGANIDPEGEEQEYRATLNAGQHEVLVTHPSGEYQSVQRRITLGPGERKTLQIALELTKAQVEYKEQLSSHRWRLWPWLTLGIVMAGYGYTESQAAADSNVVQAGLKRQAQSASDVQQYNSLLTLMRSERDTAEGHKQNSDQALLLSAAAFGLLWLLYDPPPDPPNSGKPKVSVLLGPASAGARHAVPLQFFPSDQGVARTSPLVRDGGGLGGMRISLTWGW